jgi:hypothetical protein
MMERQRWEKPTPDSPFFKDYKTLEEFLNSPLFESYKPNHHLCSRLPPELWQENIKTEPRDTENETTKSFSSTVSSTLEAYRDNDPEFHPSDESSYRKNRKRKPEEEPITIPIGPAPQHPYGLRSRTALKASNSASGSPSTSPPNTPSDAFVSVNHSNKQQKLALDSSPNYPSGHQVNVYVTDISNATFNSSVHQNNIGVSSPCRRFHMFNYEIVHKPHIFDPITQRRRNLVFLKKLPKLFPLSNHSSPSSETTTTALTSSGLISSSQDSSSLNNACLAQQKLKT